MEIPKTITDKFQSLDRAHFEKIKDNEFRPGYQLTDLKYLREKAKNERDLRELYRGRTSYELLQNADDVSAKKVAFILSQDGLVFAHDGRWFTVDNFRSLADGWSDKKPDECIGHKGLGFRSVLDITPAPYLVKVDAQEFFAIKFTWALNNGHIQETFRRNPSLCSYYKEWTKHGQLACPVMVIPGLAKKHNLEAALTVLDRLVRGKHGSQLTTMFWFPARDPDIDRKVLQELGPTPIIADAHGREVLLEFLRDEVSVLLPFLASVETVAVYENDRCISSAHISRGSEEQKEGEVTVHTEIDGHRHSESFCQVQFTFPIPPEIRNQPDTPKAVKAMKEAKVVLSVRLQSDEPVYVGKSRFHVYFPTVENTGVGFIVHGDFYVKPDRTHLMGGSYNEWLLGCAAKAAANEFLTQLLKQYHARSVFAALSSTGSVATDAADTFVSLFSKELQERARPFVPTNGGLMKQEEVILSPRIDESGFWETHFSDVVGDVVKGKKAFVAHEEDGQRTRIFLRLAQVQVLEPEALLAFIEASSQQTKLPSWWYECYSYMADDEKLSRHGYSFFAGHKLIPTTDSSVIAVPDDSSLVVCLPPSGDISALQVPQCFSSVFVFLDLELTTLLEKGKDVVRSWVLDRFRISRFEATDLLPRAVRGVVAHLFSGELEISSAELRQAWSFIKKIIDMSRTILSSVFWQEVGRFPLPLETAAQTGNLDSKSLVPGKTVEEKFLAEETSVPNTRLRNEIVNGLAPSLLAPIIAKAEKSNQSELILRRLRERFEVKVANRLVVSFSLVGDLSIEQTVDFPKFYLQRRLIQSPGAIEEAHYTLYIAGNTSVSLSGLDADALGDALTPVFLGGISNELAGLFPRIALRYQHLRGKRDLMEEFMHYQLGISREAQDMAWAMVSGETIEPKPITTPPAKVISAEAINAGKSSDDKQTTEEKIRKHQKAISEKTTNWMLKLATDTSKKERSQEVAIDSVIVPAAGKVDGITPEQRERGKRGEEEIKRRLECPGGWEGFSLIADKREHGRGYDFLCARSGREAELEVKTFTQDGRVVVTSAELQEAATSQDDYYLIGILDDGKPEHEWFTFLVRNPLDLLLTKGEFDIQAKLQASAADVFNIDENH